MGDGGGRKERKGKEERGEERQRQKLPLQKDIQSEIDL